MLTFNVLSCTARSCDGGVIRKYVCKVFENYMFDFKDPRTSGLDRPIFSNIFILLIFFLAPQSTSVGCVVVVVLGLVLFFPH